jgi:hypothetical protein
MQVSWTFNANQYEPKQGMEGHPPALKVPFTITNTAIKETKDKTGGYLSVDLTSPQGTVTSNYNIHNQSAKAVEIAYQQLSALCRAVGIYNIDGQNECAALRGGRGLMDVGYQKGEDPATNPEGRGYTELKRVYDVNGNDPAKPNAAPQGQQGGFGGQQPNPAQNPPAGGPTPMQPQQGGGWGAPQGQAPQGQPQGQQQPPQGQAWQPGGGQPGAAPPWGNR